MRVLAKNIDELGNGSVGIIMQEDDDMWHAFNLIHKGDAIKAVTFRKIKEESKTGSVVTTKKKLTLVIKVERIDYDTDGPSLRISGVSASENKYMQLGQHHTIELELNLPFTLYKRKWDELHLERLDLASNPEASCELAAIVMESGLANICLITNTSAVVKSRVEAHIPRKLKAAFSLDKALEKFFKQCSISITQHINFEKIKNLLIASPGFTKDQFFQYLTSTKPPWFDKDKVILAHSSSGEKIGLIDTLNDPLVKERISSNQFSQEMDLVEEFFLTLNKDPNRAVYGLIDVETSASQQAVQQLFISDSTLRKHKVHEREKILEVIRSVKKNGGEVHTLSSIHIAGERINQLSGIAALLRFPVYDLQENEESSAEEDEVQFFDTTLDPTLTLEDDEN
jgi:protein pelota